MEAFVTEITELKAVDGSLAGSWVLIGTVMHQLIDRLFIFIFIYRAPLSVSPL